MGSFFDLPLKLADDLPCIHTHKTDKLRNESVLLKHQCQVQMFAVKLLMSLLYPYILAVHYSRLRVLCKFFKIHGNTPLLFCIINIIYHPEKKINIKISTLMLRVLILFCVRISSKSKYSL